MEGIKLGGVHHRILVIMEGGDEYVEGKLTGVPKIRKERHKLRFGLGHVLSSQKAASRSEVAATTAASRRSEAAAASKIEPTQRGQAVEGRKEKAGGVHMRAK